MAGAAQRDNGVGRSQARRRIAEEVGKRRLVQGICGGHGLPAPDPAAELYAPVRGLVDLSGRSRRELVRLAKRGQHRVCQVDQGPTGQSRVSVYLRR